MISYTGIFPDDKWCERSIVGIDSHQAMPEGVYGHCADVFCQWAGHFQDFIDGLVNDRDQGISINRNLAFVRNREFVRTLGNNIR